LVTLTTGVLTTQIGAFYNAHVSVGHKLAGTGYGDVEYRTAKLRVFFDSLEQGEEAGVGLSLDWRGQGAGISAQLNDADFVAYDSEAGATGYLIDAQIYPPAHGLRVVGAGADAGDVARRSMRGLTVDVTSFAADPATTLTSAPSWGTWVAQRGSDVGLVVTKTTAGAALTGEPVDLGNLLHSTPALKVYADGASAARGGAIDVVGSVYQRKYTKLIDVTPVAADSLKDGGITTEAGLVAAEFVVPFPQLGNAYGYLGLPQKIMPSGHTDPFTAVEIRPPDYALYAEHHIALVSLPPTTLDVPYSKWVGQSIIFSSGASYYRIAQVISSDASEQVIALSPSQAFTAPLVAVPTAAAASIVGGRWTHAYLDIADWAIVGRALNSQSNELPWLSIAASLDESVDPVVRIHGMNDLILSAGNLSADINVFPTVLGTGVGPAVTATSADVDVTSAAYAAAADFNARRASYTYEHGWARASGQPRSPIPNTAIFSAKSAIGVLNGILEPVRGVPAGLGPRENPGFLNSEDVALEIVTGTGAVEMVFSPLWGGNIQVSETGGSPVTVRLWFPAARGMSPYLHKFTLEAHMALTAALAINLTVALRKEDGTAVTEDTTLIAATGAMRHVSQALLAMETFAVSSPPTPASMRGPLAETALSSDADEPLFLTVDVPLAAAATLNIGSLCLTPVLQPLRTPALEVTTSARVGSLRYTQSVKGFQTIAPLQAELLDGEDIALSGVEWSPVSGLAESDVLYNRGGGQEGRGVGAINGDAPVPTSWMYKSPVFDRGRFFKKGRASATISAFHPFYDPLFYVLAAPSQNPSLVGSEFIPPGVTGFLLPLDPPHGATLTNFSATLSIRPTYVFYGGNWNPKVQVWQYGAPLLGAFGYGETNTTNWVLESRWDANIGMRLVIYRQNCIDFEVEDSARTAAGVTASAGYPEVVYSAPIQIDASGLVAVPGASDSFGQELTVSVNESFGVNDPSYGSSDRDAAGFVVDRRHYAYFAAIEFYIGIRDSDGTTVDITEPVLMLSGSSSSGAGTATTWGAAVEVGGVWVAADASVSLPGALRTGGLGTQSEVVPGAVRFRGARLGWVTDRAGDGGW